MLLAHLAAFISRQWEGWDPEAENGRETARATEGIQAEGRGPAKGILPIFPPYHHQTWSWHCLMESVLVQNLFDK